VASSGQTGPLSSDSDREEGNHDSIRWRS
jgi:hypothetical protein